MEKVVPYPRLPWGLVTMLVPNKVSALSGVITFFLLCSMIVLIQLMRPGDLGLFIARELLRARE